MGNTHGGILRLKEESKMPWRQESTVEQRLRFVIEARQGEASISALCRRYESSRKTGYKWLRRYEEAKTIAALNDRSRRPRHSPNRSSSAREQQVLAVRDQKGWGAEKISVVVGKSGTVIPAITVHRILKRHGRIKPPVVDRIAWQRFARAGCNELAQMDFKGEYRLRVGGKCYPLTLLDDCSRYLLGLWPLPSTEWPAVQAILRAHFREVGVPREMLMDHGSTWYANYNGHGLTKLSIWLIKQDIRLRFSGIGHPQTQGKVEQLHGTLKKRTKHRGVPETMKEWRAWSAEFQHEYNCERPHSALGMKTPQQVYTRDNLRPYQEQPREWEYSGGEVKRLDSAGGLHKYGSWFFVCKALAKEWVRLDELDNRLTVTFRHLTIREIDLQTKSSTMVLLPSDHHNNRS
jgi:transposase InsO family protein